MTTKTRRLTLDEQRAILAEGPEPTGRGPKLRLIALSMQNIVLPVMGKDGAESEIIADLMDWADEADLAEHALTCKDCATALIDDALTQAETRFGVAENQPIQ